MVGRGGRLGSGETGGETPQPPVSYFQLVRDCKRQLIEAALRESGGNRAEAARQLGIQRSHLYRLIRQLEIHSP
ncbi:MAG: helix-turn-helix domain-containing protein [Betaproteobacteria bacterium]|nr:helix-turn-helix domain-containing protein [Betaproteobacteria bacterium]